MSAAGEQAQHARGVVGVARFAEDYAVYNDNGVGTEDEIVWAGAEHSLRFFLCHALGEISRKLAFARNFWDAGWLYNESNARIAQELLAPGRSRSEHEHAANGSLRFP